MPRGLYISHYPIRFSHTDMAGIVYYPNFFDMFQTVVEDWFDHWLGIRYATLISERKVALPSVRAACDFLSPARIGDTLDLTVRLDKIGRTSIAIRIDGAVRGVPCLRGEVVLVTLSLETFKSIPIPADIAARLEDYRNSVSSETSATGRDLNAN
jgi:4-hydroxybenzoyl-CoA thioesterase